MEHQGAACCEKGVATNCESAENGTAIFYCSTPLFSKCIESVLKGKSVSSICNWTKPGVRHASGQVIGSTVVQK